MAAMPGRHIFGMSLFQHDGSDICIWRLGTGRKRKGKYSVPCMIQGIWADINTVLSRSWAGIVVGNLVWVGALVQHSISAWSPVRRLN